MSIWPNDEYTKDIIESLFKKEGRRDKFCFRSPQNEERPLLVSWVSQVAQELKLRNCTFHLAVYVLDIFMDNHDIATPQLKLLAIVCLLLAAKFEELDSNVPKISTLKSKVDGNYLATEFITMEIVILNFVDWNLAYPTVAHFLECFGNFVIQPSDQKCCHGKDKCHKTNQDTRCKLKQLVLDANEIIQDSMSVVIQDIGYMTFRPSLIAAAVIFLARYMLSLQPEWTPTLEEITKLNVSDILPCSAWLKQEMDVDKRKNTSSIDQGYSTHSSSSTPDLFIVETPSRDQEGYLVTPAPKRKKKKFF